MNARSHEKPMTKRDWLIPAGLILLTIVPALGGAVRLNDLANAVEVTAKNARFHASPLPILIHIPAALLYGFLGALQFSPGFRKRNRPWHRTAGKVLLPAAILTAGSGLWMTLFYPWAPGDGLAVYLERIIVGVASLVFIGLGIEAIRRRQYAKHGEWMIRAYALGIGAGTQVLTHLPWFILADQAPGETARGIMMGGAWAINAIVAEVIIRWPKRRAVAAMAPTRMRAVQASPTARAA
jgi:uncharacterized membrane protein